jgi:tellurite resistance protein TerC
MNWMNHLRSLWNHGNIKIVRRIVVAVVGATVLLIGIALMVLPGPAFVVIPIGLAILATEFAWARHWLKKVREMAASVIPGRNAPNEDREMADTVRNEETHRAEQD